ncbi:hypothetical protein [Actinomycetospora lemnae]|uniref:Uncharacterized protein n=1 Tax=Actinomycetospora lemnae TaxID=3019891 RepID=A0ABT5T0B3_9PSEU|nr:hypothetical protein [Actinomycetospora sp. DW7H6]MDD7967398.1 hypothetical protein [Actinomycetospora sp. DW7H6]
MSTPDGVGRAGPDGRRAALLSGAGVLAVAAGAAVVLADDARWLRLAVVAALWAVVLVVLVLARRGRSDAELAEIAEEAREAEEGRAAAEEEAEERVAALHRDLDRRVAREVAAREEAEQTAERAREEVASLRDELDRTRREADAVTLQSVGVPAVPAAPPRPRGPRLRVVGDSGPQPRVPSGPPGPPPAPRRPALPSAPAPRTPGSVAGRRVEPPTEHTARPLRPAPPPSDGPPSDPAVLAAGSFVDNYVRAAGYETLPEPPEPSDGPEDRRPRRAPTDAPSGGRTVAELLAAHAASGGTVGRRRRDP